MQRTTLCALICSFTLAGCYTYRPITVNEVTPSMNVRVEADSDQGADRVEGQVFEVDGGSLSLLPEVRPGMDDAPRMYRFSEVVSVTQRTLHTGRTLAVLGVTAAIGAGALLVAVKGNPGDTRPPSGGTGGFDLIPILRGLIGH